MFKSKRNLDGTKIVRGYKYRIYPTPEQEEKLRGMCGQRRWIWNRCLAIWNRYYEMFGKSPRVSRLTSQLTKWRARHRWLMDGSQRAQRNVVRDLDMAWSATFSKYKKQGGKLEPPKFKAKFKAVESFRTPSGRFAIDGYANRWMFLNVPKVKGIKVRKHRELPVETKDISDVTVSWHGGMWFASFSCYIDKRTEPHDSESECGVDLGVARVVTVASAHEEEGMSYSHVSGKSTWKHLDEKIKKHQKKLAAMTKKSNRWHRLKQIIAKLEAKRARCRKNRNDSISHDLASSHKTIFLEDLSLKNMTKSAKGTIEEPGKNVKQKSGLNREMLNQGLGQLVSMIKYKSEERNGEVVLVDPKYTSQRCAKCGHTAKANRKTQDAFKCLSCGYVQNADNNAAENILQRGQKGRCEAHGKKAKDGFRNVNSAEVSSKERITDGELCLT